MNPYRYTNGAGQCFPLRELPLEPVGCWSEEEEQPACKCTQCGQSVWPGESTYGDGAGHTLCKECFTELLFGEVKHNLDEIAELLGYDVMLQI